LVTGCSGRKGPERIVATINDYTMTVEDFNYESKEILHTAQILGDIPVTKENILDALVTKEVLLQEAQKNNLDKDKSFMKTIELYWEQTLLKNLLMKKSGEISRKIVVYEDEILDYYSNMKEKVKAKVLVSGDESAMRKLLGYRGDLSEYVRNDPKGFPLLYMVPSKWYVLGRENSLLEDSIFNMDKNKDRELAKIDEKWALIIIEERASSELEPLHVIRDDIEEQISRKKEREFMNEWIEGLRSKTHIRINRKILSDLP
jgi:hypothetical protein